MPRHANQKSTYATASRSATAHAQALESPFERTLTRSNSGHSRFNYELRTTAGAVLQGCDRLDSLLRHLDEKRNVIVVRTRDEVVVSRSPELDS